MQLIRSVMRRRERIAAGKGDGCFQAGKRTVVSARRKVASVDRISQHLNRRPLLVSGGQMAKHQIRIMQMPSDRVQFTKALRLVGQLGLKQANDLANYMERFRDSVLIAGIEPSVADHLSEILLQAGAKVLVEECSIETPMLCCPAANTKFQWTAFRTIEKVS